MDNDVVFVFSESLFVIGFDLEGAPVHRSPEIENNE